MLSRELGALIREICDLDRERFDVLAGLNTRDGKFNLSVARHPYRFGDAELVRLFDMPLTLANVVIARRKLQELPRPAADEAVQERLDLGDVPQRGDPADVKRKGA